MKTFIQYVKAQQLQEKLIVLNNGAKYGQIIFLAGGGGSGKGFALKNFVDAESYKVRDVDQMKQGLLDLQTHIADIRKLPDCSPDEKPVFDKLKGLHCNPFSQIRNLNLRNPKDVFELHQFVDVMGLKDTTLKLMLQASLMGNENRAEANKILPNILFDITAKNMKSIAPVLQQLMDVGYDPHDVHLIWVLANYSVAVERNAKRSRVVPDDVLLDTHEGAANTMHTILTQGVPNGIDGGVYVILNRDLRQHDEIDPHTGDVVKSDYYTDGKTVKTFDYIQVKEPGRPLSIEKEMERLKTWILGNIPRSKGTQNIIDKPLERH
jgi:hypothetical protein